MNRTFLAATGPRWPRPALASLLVVWLLYATHCAAQTRATFIPAQPHANAPTSGAIARALHERFHVDLATAASIADATLAAARRDALSPLLLLAMMQAESGFDPRAVSAAGARGLMQILPAQHRDRLPGHVDLSDADTNIRIGAAILHGYLADAGGNLYAALLRYSGGARGYPQRIAQNLHRLSVALDPSGALAHSDAAFAQQLASLAAY